MRRVLPAAGLAVLALACAARSGRGGAPDDAVALARAWSALPAAELDRVWESAQATGSVVAVEPESAVVGTRAAKKKTWAVADLLLKFFVYGFQPNWFPGDVVRRTACGTDPRWAYFWHLLSGDERDLHPWFDGREGFAHLLGEKGAVVLGGGAVDLADCREVRGDGTPERPCLYGEVTAPAGFDEWFCGGAGGGCRGQLLASPTKAPPDLAEPEVGCVHGPFVLERAHDLRPEIHPAEVVWVRKASERGHWTFALVPDDSGRFREAKHYEEGASGDEWRPWSADRPVELWVAFSTPAASPVVFDLAVKAFGSRPEPARQVSLAPPGPAGAFTVLPHDLSSVVTAAARTWEAGPGTRRGLLVLRAWTANSARRALVLRLRGRAGGEAEAPVELAPGVDPGALAPPVPTREARVRLLGFTRVQSGSAREARVSTLVRFDPARPAEPLDEQRADALNEALRGGRAERVAAFGTDRPFRVEWEVLPADVAVAASRGPATSSVVVTNRDARAALSAGERPVYLGSLQVRLGREGAALGEGQVVYQGREVGLVRPGVRVVFRLPEPTYASEWDLVSAVLDAVDGDGAAARLDALRRDACAPAAPAECDGAFLAPSVARSLRDPAARFATLRELERGGRPFARFVRLFARALVWDGEVEEKEREKLVSLLATDSASAGTPGTPAAASRGRAAAAKAYEDVRARPADPAALAALKAILPRLGEYYVVEGDLKLTEDQVAVYAASLAGGAGDAPRSGELLVNVVGGKAERWCASARDLTYAVDRASFGDEGRYEEVVRNVAAAARDWERACPECRLTFTHRREHDDAPSLEKVVFVVRAVDAGGAFVALAFFPSDPPSERYLSLDPSYFADEFDRVGVVRHELGHVLGYRHEHIREVPGCYREDRAWIALGAYDPKSAMHYPCGGGGGSTFELSASDRKGHRNWYSRTDGGEPCAAGSASR